MKKTFKVVLLMVLTAFLCTGCITADLNMKLSKSGKLKLMYIIGFTENFVKESGGEKKDLYKQLDNLKKDMEDGGFKAKKYEDDKVLGYKFTKTFRNVFRDGGFSDNYMTHSINRERTFFFTKYTWNGKFTLNGNVMLNSDSVVTIEMPVKVNSTNADQISENRKKLQWHLITGRTNEITIETQCFNTGKIVAILALLIIFGLYANRFLKSKNNSEKASDSSVE